METLAQTNPGIQVALDAYKEFVATPQYRELAERRAKFIRDTKAQLETDIDKARKLGIKEGREEGVEEGQVSAIAQNLVDLVMWFISEPSDELVARIKRINDLDKLHWLYQSVGNRTISSLEDFEQAVEQERVP